MKQSVYGKIGLFAGVWTLVGIFFSVQFYVFERMYAKPVSWKIALIGNMPDWYLWAFFSLLIHCLAQRFPLERGKVAKFFAVHVPASLAVALVHLALAATSSYLFVRFPEHRERSWMMVYKYHLGILFHWDILIYWGILGLSHGLTFYRRYQDRERKAAQLEAKLAQAQLQALKIQLHPHFLFNTLHSISSLLHKDVDAADQMIARLGDFLRKTLENTGAQEVTLEEELDLLRSYLEIERIRFQDRLTIRFETDAGTLDAMVPSLIWQPFAENALRYGIAPRSDPGYIEVGAKRIEDKLRLWIRDDGPGIPSIETYKSTLREGVGISNTRERLRHLYGNNHFLGICNAPDRGLIVTLEIPFKREMGVQVLRQEYLDGSQPIGAYQNSYR
ncbi:MAG: histidine kinase [Terriglobia bacterium]